MLRKFYFYVGDNWSATGWDISNFWIDIQEHGLSDYRDTTFDVEIDTAEKNISLIVKFSSTCRLILYDFLFRVLSLLLDTLKAHFDRIMKFGCSLQQSRLPWTIWFTARMLQKTLTFRTKSKRYLLFYFSCPLLSDFVCLKD